MASGDTRGDSMGMSRSRKVRVNDPIQRAQAAADGARKARGKPPRIQSVSRLLVPTSDKAKPPTSINRILPASVSETPLTRSQDALPTRRNTAFRPGSSQIGRSTSNSWGSRWTSSRTTSPCSRRSSVSGVADSALRTATSSRSKAVAGPSSQRRRAAPRWSCRLAGLPAEPQPGPRRALPQLLPEDRRVQQIVAYSTPDAR